MLTLLKDGEASVGAFATTASGAVQNLRAKAVVLATGGIGRDYKITRNSWEYTGDGHSPPMPRAQS